MRFSGTIPVTVLKLVESEIKRLDDEAKQHRPSSKDRTARRQLQRFHSELEYQNS